MFMKYLMALIEGSGALDQAKKPNIDLLSSAGRIGLAECRGKSRTSRMAEIVCGSDRPPEPFLEALGLGLGPAEGELCLSLRSLVLGSSGNSVKPESCGYVYEPGAVSEIISSIEIDGVRFRARGVDGRMVVVASGEKLSDRLAPGPFPAPGMPLAQVSASSAEAKPTASTLNKLLYRAHKMLTPGALALLEAGLGRPGNEFGMSACCISHNHGVRGMAVYAGMEALDSPANPDISELPHKDFVLVHAEGSEAMEVLDSSLFARAEDRTCIVVWASEGAMPVMVSGGGIMGGGGKFCEAGCSRGFRIESSMLLPWILRATRSGVG